MQNFADMDVKEPVAKKARTKPKSFKDWEENDIFKLISLVEAEPCLWNASMDGYHNKAIRDIGWLNIADNFEPAYSVVDVTTKWTNLRIQYRGYAARSKTKSGQGTMEMPKWKYFNAMAFVGRAEDHQTQPTISNLNIAHGTDNNIDSDTPTTSTPPLSTPTITRRTQPSNQQSAATQIAETMRDAVNVMKERKENASDPNTSFANYILSELKTLNSTEAATVRKKVTLFFIQCLDEEKNSNSKN
ncbi:uncharacterized protein LOC119612290 [Lucilia sericata]|uniref:uncharacterized protein LOC119612290 n=1 Tax=Lucilia sericata TaxID=13632 RepID=UPI0018A81F7E|nr:uncharacterized protein LOC119612290 [Lucilia sericata]